MTIQDQLRAEYEQYLILGRWHWETEVYCSEDGFETATECYADFEQFIATLED
jgi:hypothetical protein